MGNENEIFSRIFFTLSAGALAPRAWRAFQLSARTHGETGYAAHQHLRPLSRETCGSQTPFVSVVISACIDDPPHSLCSDEPEDRAKRRLGQRLWAGKKT